MFICSSRLCRKPASLGFQEILSWSLMLFYPMGGTVCMALVLHWFYMFWFYKINQNNAALVRPSPKNFRILWCAQAIQSLGISKIWLWSTCAGKIEQAEQFQARHTSRPWICSRRSGRTWRSFGTSRLWHFFANIRRIGLRRWLDAFFAFFCNTLFLFSMVDHPSKAFKSDIFRRGKPKQQGRQLLQKELPVQAARRGAWRRLQGMGGPWPPYPADGDDNVSDGVWPAGPEDREGCLEGQLMSFHDLPQSNTCRSIAVSITPGSRPTLLRRENAEAHWTEKKSEWSWLYSHG